MDQNTLDQQMLELWAHPGFRHLCGVLRERVRAQVLEAALSTPRDDAKLNQLAAKLEVLNDLKVLARGLAYGADARLRSEDEETTQ